MPPHNFTDLFTSLSLWEKILAGIIAGLTVTFILWIVRSLFRRFKPKDTTSHANREIKVGTAEKSALLIADGDNAYQEQNIDKSYTQSGGIHIGDVGPGATVTINVIDYQDGISKSPKSEVRELFNKARAHFTKKEFDEAIRDFMHCLDIEQNSEKRGALNLQIGNCFYQKQMFLKAAEFYAAGLRESRRANNSQGEASNLVCIANTFIFRSAAIGKVRGDNLRKAVEIYGNALKIFKKDEYPIQYAMTQKNLGKAYRDLPSATAEERAKNVRAAIDCYRRAIEIHKKDEYPVEYATTQNSFGNAYKELPSATAEERAKNVRAAIDCFHKALEIFKRDEYPFKYAATQNNLGTAYADLPSATAEERTKNVMSARDCFQRALEIYKKDERPVEYAKTQNNLGLAYINLPSATAEERTKNVKTAIDCFQRTLEICKKDEYLIQYAMTQNNLGLAYINLPSKTAEERAKNVRAAIGCFQMALEIRKKDEYPQYYCQTAANLGLALVIINIPDACYWLKEAYALREYLDDQGKWLEKIIQQICKKEPE